MSEDSYKEEKYDSIKGATIREEVEKYWIFRRKRGESLTDYISRMWCIYFMAYQYRIDADVERDRERRKRNPASPLRETIVIDSYSKCFKTPKKEDLGFMPTTPGMGNFGTGRSLNFEVGESSHARKTSEEEKKVVSPVKVEVTDENVGENDLPLPMDHDHYVADGIGNWWNPYSGVEIKELSSGSSKSVVDSTDNDSNDLDFDDTSYAEGKDKRDQIN